MLTLEQALIIVLCAIIISYLIARILRIVNGKLLGGKKCQTCKYFSCFRPVSRKGLGWCEQPDNLFGMASNVADYMGCKKWREYEQNR